MSEKTLRHSHLRLAGWLSFVSAIVAVPLFLLAIFSETMTQYRSEVQLLSTLLFILYTGVYCYVFMTFRDYLNKHFSFHGVDRQIAIIIGLTVTSAVLEAISYMFGGVSEAASLVTILLLIPLGIVSIQMGLSLLSLKDSLSGLRSTYAYLLIFSGVFLTSIVLLIPGILLGIALDTILGIILIRAGAERAS